jgi:hypothetical protein
MIVSGLEIIFSDNDWDVYELQIVNPKAKKMVCDCTGFYDPWREKEIREWAASKSRCRAPMEAVTE